MEGQSTLDLDHLRQWIGRQETRSDVVTPRLVEAFVATLDLSPPSLESGNVAPLGIHWCLAPAAAPMRELGIDDHDLIELKIEGAIT